MSKPKKPARKPVHLGKSISGAEHLKMLQEKYGNQPIRIHAGFGNILPPGVSNGSK